MLSERTGQSLLGLTECDRVSIINTLRPLKTLHQQFLSVMMCNLIYIYTDVNSFNIIFVSITYELSNKPPRSSKPFL